MNQFFKSAALSLSAVTVVLFTAFDIIHSWKIKENYHIKFVHMDAEGVFQKFYGDILFDENKPADALFDVKIDVNSVESGNPMRNASISNDWLNSGTFPHIYFKAKGATKVDGKWLTTGQLDLHGIKKNFTVPFSFMGEADSALFESNFELNMKEFNLSDEDEVLKLFIRVPVMK